MTQLQKIVAKAKTLRKSYPKLKWTDLIKKASKLVTPAKKSVSGINRKVVAKKSAPVKHLIKKRIETKSDFAMAGVGKKKATKKAVKKSPARSLHKDTKSHNVNIRVMSGVKHKNLPPVKTKSIILLQSDYNDALHKLERWTALLNDYKMDYKLEKDPIWKKFYKNEINKISKTVSELKTHLKHIK